MKHLLVSSLLLLSIGCVRSGIEGTPTPQMMDSYQPDREISFCLTEKGKVVNVIQGGAKKLKDMINVLDGKIGDMIQMLTI